MTSEGVFNRYSFNARERSHLFHSAGGRRFLEAGYPAGLDVDLESRGVAVADLDRDGGLDLLVRSVARRKLLLFRNELAGRGQAIQLELVGTRSNRDGVGALVRIAAGGRRAIAERRAGTGFQGQSDPALHFGLGDAARVDEVVVEWPAGGTDRCTGLEAGRRVRIVEGRGCVSSTPFVPAPAAAADPPPPAWTARAADGEVFGPGPHREPPHGGRSEDGRAGTPTLVSMWASWCAPCRTEVGELNRLAGGGRDDVTVVGVSIADDLDAARRFAAETDARYPLAVAAPDEMAPLLEASFADGRLDLPSAVLLDRRGEVVRAFRGPVRTEVLERELRRLRLREGLLAEGLGAPQAARRRANTAP